MVRKLRLWRRGLSAIMMATMSPVVVFAGAPPKIASAEKTSYAEVTRQLNPGGQYYSYVSMEGMLDSLPEKIDTFRNAMLSAADKTDPEYKQVEAVFDILAHLVESSGLQELSGVGMSSIARDSELYFNRAVYHHYPGKGTGKFWSLFGGEPCTSSFLSMLPAETALCTYSKLDVAEILEWIRTACRETGHEELLPLLDSPFEKAQAMGIPAKEILDSLEGEIGVVVTIDSETTRPFKPEADLELQIPDVGIAFATQVSSPIILQTIDERTKANANIEREQRLGAEWRSTMIPVPVPVKLAPTVMQKDSLLVFASNKTLAEQLLTVPAGDHPALADTEDFKTMAQNVPRKAASFHFAGPAVANTIDSLFEQFAAQKADEVPPGAKAGIDQLLNLYTSLLLSCGATVDTDEGFVYSGNSAVSMGRMATLQSSAVPVAIIAGMLLPALSQAREKARRVSCMSNLKQIGLACFMYANDNGNGLPGPDRLKKLLVEGYLPDPGLFVCPSSDRTAAPTPKEFSPHVHSSYLYFGQGLKQLSEIDNPSRTVLAADRAGNHEDGINVLFADGHVQFFESPNIQQAARQHNLVLPEVQDSPDTE